MGAAPRDQFVKKDRHGMDGTRFDQLIKSSHAAREPSHGPARAGGGRGRSVTGLSLFGEEGEAKKGQEKRTATDLPSHQCHSTLLTKKLKAKRAKKHLQAASPCDTKGRCAGRVQRRRRRRPTTPAPAPGFHCTMTRSARSVRGRSALVRPVTKPPTGRCGLGCMNLGSASPVSGFNNTTCRLRECDGELSATH